METVLKLGINYFKYIEKFTVKVNFHFKIYNFLNDYIRIFFTNYYYFIIRFIIIVNLNLNIITHFPLLLCHINLKYIYMIVIFMEYFCYCIRRFYDYYYL